MRRTTALLLAAGGAVAVALGIAIPDWHRPVRGAQIGPDGTGNVQFAETSPWQVPPAPAPEPAAETGGPAATETYRNVTVLTDLSAAEFMRVQRAMTAWVSPAQGCGFCHTGENYAADDNPMKGATRDMLRLTRHLNTAWRGHVGEAGVTCFSCHRGEPVPPETWFPRTAKAPRPLMARSENWDEAGDTVRKFFPDDGWALYLLGDEPIRAESTTALRSGSVAPAVEVKRVYEMMMQMSDGIGVNCGYCHASRAFSDWSQSTPARWVAYDAFRMMRDVNRTYLLPSALPQSRDLVHANAMALPPEARGPRDGVGLAVCATCHYGHVRPEAGVPTLATYGAFASAVNAAVPAAPQTPALPSAPGAPAAPAAPAK